MVEQLGSDRLLDEAHQDVVTEDLGRPTGLREVVLGPAAVTIADVLGAPEEVRDPADVTLGEGELQRGELLPEGRPYQVDQCVDRRRRRHRHGDPGRCVRRRGRRARRRPEVTGQHGVVLHTGREQRLPVARVDRGHVERLGVLRERHCVAALLREALDLLRRPLDVVEGQHATRDEAVGVGTAPLVDVPVVVGLDHDLVDVGVRPLVQHLARKAGPVGEVQAGELTTGVHVTDALVHVVAAGPHLVVAAGIDVEVLRVLPGNRVEAQVAALQVAVPPLLDAPLVGAHLGCELLVFRRDMVVEHVGRLGDVVIDADQNDVVRVHGSPLPRPSVGWPRSDASDKLYFRATHRVVVRVRILQR